MEQLIIIEGIPGAGKDTLQNKLVKELEKENTIFSFQEEDLLWSWRHAWIPHIAEMRLELMHNMLDFVKKEIEKDKKCVFILNRFHISFKYYNYEEKHKEAYEKILKKLRTLSTKIYIPIVKSEEIKKRSSHDERIEIWKEHLKRRLAWAGFSNITEMYTAEQKRILSLVKEQEISFEIVRT